MTATTSTLASRPVRRSRRRKSAALLTEAAAVKVAPFESLAVRFPVLKVEHALIADDLRFSSLSDGMTQIQIWVDGRWVFAELNSAAAIEAGLQLRESAMRAELMKMEAVK